MEWKMEMCTIENFREMRHLRGGEFIDFLISQSKGSGRNNELSFANEEHCRTIEYIADNDCLSDEELDYDAYQDDVIICDLRSIFNKFYKYLAKAKSEIKAMINEDKVKYGKAIITPIQLINMDRTNKDFEPLFNRYLLRRKKQETNIIVINAVRSMEAFFEGRVEEYSYITKKLTHNIDELCRQKLNHRLESLENQIIDIKKHLNNGGLLKLLEFMDFMKIAIYTSMKIDKISDGIIKFFDSNTIINNKIDGIIKSHIIKSINELSMSMM